MHQVKETEKKEKDGKVSERKKTGAKGRVVES